MMKDLINSKLLTLNNLTRTSVKQFSYKRYLYENLLSDRSRIFNAIVGPRGVGKTILLQQLSSSIDNSFYLSTDTFDRDVDLFKLIKVLKDDYSFDTFFIDEIHVNRSYQQSLKNIYDFLDVKIFFTSSMALSLVSSSYDLSRRVKLHELHVFPFWEFLKIHEIEVEGIELEQLLRDEISPKFNRYAEYFDKYLKWGALPFSEQVADPLDAQKNIITAIIEKDIPSNFSVTSDELFDLKKVIEFIAYAQADGVNYSSISSNVGVTKYKAQKYIDILVKAFILNVSIPHGANVSKEPKILMYLPNRLVYLDYVKSIGALREDFATTMFRYLELDYSYLKTTRGKKTPDFFLNISGKKIVCEIGGKGKGREQFKELKNYDKKIVFKHTEDLQQGDYPLFILGLIKKS